MVSNQERLFNVYEKKTILGVPKWNVNARDVISRHYVRNTVSSLSFLFSPSPCPEFPFKKHSFRRLTILSKHL